VSRVIAVTNQKGGVGKTTTAINLGAALAVSDVKVLLIDADPQGNTTSGLGIQKTSGLTTIYDVLVDGKEIEHAICHSGMEGLDVLPADKNLIGVNLQLVSVDDRESILRHHLKRIRDRYEFILIDCPPALDLLTLNALMAADSVLIPIQCEFFALEGISELMDTIERIRDSFGHPLKIEGILDESRPAGSGRSEGIFRDRGLQDCHSAQYSSCRGSQPRKVHPCLRPGLAWFGILYTACQGGTHE
jgi:chromosome partitioning protein